MKRLRTAIARRPYELNLITALAIAQAALLLSMAWGMVK